MKGAFALRCKYRIESTRCRTRAYQGRMNAFICGAYFVCLWQLDLLKRCLWLGNNTIQPRQCCSFSSHPSPIAMNSTGIQAEAVDRSSKEVATEAQMASSDTSKTAPAEKELPGVLRMEALNNELTFPERCCLFVSIFFVSYAYVMDAVTRRLIKAMRLRAILSTLYSRQSTSSEESSQPSSSRWWRSFPS